MCHDDARSRAAKPPRVACVTSRIDRRSTKCGSCGDCRDGAAEQDRGGKRLAELSDCLLARELPVLCGPRSDQGLADGAGG